MIRDGIGITFTQDYLITHYILQCQSKLILSGAGHDKAHDKLIQLPPKYILQIRVLVFLEKQHLIGLLLQFLCVQKSALKIASNGHWPKFVGVFSNSVELGHFDLQLQIQNPEFEHYLNISSVVRPQRWHPTDSPLYDHLNHTNQKDSESL